MPAERLEMRRVREILRYRAEQGLGHKSIAVRVGAAPSTVRETLRRATAAGLSWPLDDDMSDAVLEAALYKAAGMRIPMMPDGYSDAKPDRHSNLMPDAVPI